MASWKLGPGKAKAKVCPDSVTPRLNTNLYISVMGNGKNSKTETWGHNIVSAAGRLRYK